MTAPLQAFGAYQGDDKTLRFTATTNGDVTGDTYEWILADASGAVVLRKTSPTDITIITPGSASTKAVLLVSLVDSLDIDAGEYFWQLRRTNDDRKDTLAAGGMPLDRSFA